MSRFAGRSVIPVAAVTAALLVLVAGRYGYHRDELYFLEAGGHLSWGYPDQPPLVPVVARAVSALAPESLVALRVPSALIAAGVVVLAGLMAARLGARMGGQLLAATATALTGVVLAMGHLLSTATFGLLGWTLLTYFLLRLLQGEDRRLWLVVGLIAGVTMLANVLVAFLLLTFVLSVLLVGPRSLVLSAAPWIAGGIAALLALPYLLWQAGHGWPQLEVARNIAEGGSGTSASWLLFLPLVVLQVGPWLAPFWGWGLVRLLRDTALRSLGTTFVVLLLLFWLTGGKPYYLAGLYPLLFAAGAQPFLDWVPRKWVVPTLLILSLPAVVLVLPLLPVRWVNVVVPVNYDAGETVGWPPLVHQVAAAHRDLPAGTAILTGNYGTRAPSTGTDPPSAFRKLSAATTGTPSGATRRTRARCSPSASTRCCCNGAAGSCDPPAG